MPVRDRARHLVRNGLRRAGLDVRRAGRGPRQALGDVIRNARACGLSAGGIIDVGVAMGTPGLYDAWPEAQLLLIDPLAEWEGHLRHITAGRGSYVIAAAGASEGSTQLHVHSAPQLSSVMGDRDELDALGGQTTPRVVDVVTLDAIADELPGPLVIKVDVEGAELDVLRGAATVLARTELVLVETSLFEFLPGQPLVHEVVAFMAQRGFVVYDVFGGHLRLLDEALAQVDLAFARRGGVLRRDQRYASPAQAQTLYRSWAAPG